MPVSIGHTLLVVANTGVDKNFVVASLYKPGMHAGDDSAGFCINMIGEQPIAVLLKAIGVKVRKETNRVEQGANQFLYPGDFHISDLPLHDYAPLPYLRYVGGRRSSIEDLYLLSGVKDV